MLGALLTLSEPHAKTAITPIPRGCGADERMCLQSSWHTMTKQVGEVNNTSLLHSLVLC